MGQQLKRYIFSSYYELPVEKHDIDVQNPTSLVIVQPFVLQLERQHSFSFFFFNCKIYVHFL